MYWSVCLYIYTLDSGSFQHVPTFQFGLIYIYFIGQQGKPYIKAFDLRLEAVQQNIYYITIYNISAQIQLQKIQHWIVKSVYAKFVL